MEKGRDAKQKSDYICTLCPEVCYVIGSDSAVIFICYLIMRDEDYSRGHRNRILG